MGFSIIFAMFAPSFINIVLKKGSLKPFTLSSAAVFESPYSKQCAPISDFSLWSS